MLLTQGSAGPQQSKEGQCAQGGSSGHLGLPLTWGSVLLLSLPLPSLGWAGGGISRVAGPSQHHSQDLPRPHRQACSLEDTDLGHGL